MLPGRYARVRSQIWQRVTGRWVTVTGKRRERGVLITLHDASPAGVTLPSVLARTRDSRHDRTCRRTAAMDVYASRSARSSVEAEIGGPPTHGGLPSCARVTL